jgi:transposase
MAGKTKRMSQVKQVLMLFSQGRGNKEIARMLDMSKNTVKSYRKKVDQSGVPIDLLLQMDDPVLEVRFHAGNPAYLDDRFIHLKSNLDTYVKELGDPRSHVTKYILWEEYRQAHPEGYGYTQFCYHISQHKKAKKPSMVLDHEPADMLFVDFAGDKTSYTDRETGEIIECQVFVACLPYSDYSFVMAVRQQTIEDFLHALGCCLKAFGGVPKLLVSDNLRAAVIKPDRYDPSLSQALDDFANHYGFAICPARVRRPQDKALVENQVKLIYARIYAKLRHRQFFSLDDLNKAFSEKNKLHTQTRQQRKPYTREEKFLADERPALAPLPVTEYEIKYYKEMTVANNNHVLLSTDNHYYSVPYAHIASKVKVVYTRSMVRIYAKGEQVAVHIRDYRQGKYSTVRDHLCSAHQHYQSRSPEYYVSMAEKKSLVLSQFIEKLFESGQHPELLYRSCDGLLALQRKTEPDVFDRTCQKALDHRIYSYSFVKNTIKNNATDNELTEVEKALPPHENIRGKKYYETQTTIHF